VASPPFAAVASETNWLVLFAAIPVTEDRDADRVRPTLLNPLLFCGDVGDAGARVEKLVVSNVFNGGRTCTRSSRCSSTGMDAPGTVGWVDISSS
jgi:hypothetical protein